MSILYPVLYLALGWILGKCRLDIKQSASRLLTQAVIPVVIVWNIATHFKTMGTVIIVSMAAMYVAYLIGKRVTQDPVDNMCLYCLNVGWLGLPIATPLLGEQAATLIIAAFVGNSIFGNTIALRTLANTPFNLRMLCSLPVISVMVGMVIAPFGDVLQYYLTPVYSIFGFLMSFLGMLILGLWLSNTRLGLEDIRQNILPYLTKTLIWIGIVTVIGLLFTACRVPLTLIQWKTLYFISLLPPAANIIVLETHYRQTGRSASIILCGTVISLLAIVLYMLLITLLIPH